MDIRKVAPTRLAWVIPAAVALGSITGIVAAPAANAANYGPIVCRSNTHPPYWLNGINSDACDGYYGDGHFTGESVATVDGNPAYSSTGPIERCTVQLNRVSGGVAYPIHGDNRTGVTYDNGLSCDVWDNWNVPAGQYNVTTSYEANGVWYTTVQGPVSNYPGN